MTNVVILESEDHQFCRGMASIGRLELEYGLTSLGMTSVGRLKSEYLSSQNTDSYALV